MSLLKKQLFESLSDHLMAKLQHNDGVPSITTVDKDFGQFDLMQQGIIALPLPAVLISFPDTEYESTLGPDQSGEGFLRIRIGMQNFYDSDTYSPNRSLALNFFDFNARAHTAMMQFSMEHIGGIQRIKESEDDNHGAVIITEITYKYTLMDTVQNPDVIKATGTFIPRAQLHPEPPPEVDTGYVIPK